MSRGVVDVLSFKETRDKDRRAGLRELSRMTEEFGVKRVVQERCKVESHGLRPQHAS